MHVIRYGTHNTSDTVSAILRLIEDPLCAEIRFFATQPVEADVASPYMRVLARYRISPIESDFYVLMDEICLTAYASHRYSEIKLIMDAAEEKAHIYWSEFPVPMTGDLSPAVAIAEFLSKPVNSFTQKNRALFFRHISPFSEAEFGELTC